VGVGYVIFIVLGFSIVDKYYGK
jgi:hypothetical protein